MLYDGVPVPKVIDFGVAKATGGHLTEKTAFTGYGHVIGTLEYMSPERARLDQLDIDTRSDIYSLGWSSTNSSPARRRLTAKPWSISSRGGEKKSRCCLPRNRRPATDHSAREAFTKHSTRWK